LEKAALTIFLFVLVLGVLLFGAVHTYVYTFVFIGVLFASVLLLKANLKKDFISGNYQYRFLQTSLNPLFFTYLGFIILQSIPIPEVILNFASPEALVVGKMSQPASSLAASDTTLNNRFSLAPYFYPVRQSIIRWVVYWLIFWGLTQTLNFRKRIDPVIFVILVLGCFEVLYGLAETYSGSDRIWWFQKQFYRDDVTGTYINRNHFAGYMEMGLLLAAAFAAGLSEKSKKKRINFGKEKGIISKIPDFLSSDQLYTKKFLVLFAGAVMGVGLVFSASRGGMIAAVGAMFLMGALLLLKERHRRKGVILLALFVLTSIYAYQIGVDYPLERFRSFFVSYESRIRYAQKTLEMAADYRLAGVGLGNFQHAYPKYQSAHDINAGIHYAHNDWAQFTAEAGIIGLFLLLIAIIFYLYRTFKLWRKRRDPYALCIGAAPFAVIGAMAIHSYSDFNLHIPANFLLLAVIIAVGYSALHRERRFKTERMLFRYHVFSLDIKGVILLLVFFGLILWTGFWTVRHFAAEAYCNTMPNSTLNRDQNPTLEEIQKAIRWDPYNAAYRYKLALKLIRFRNAESGKGSGIKRMQALGYQVQNGNDFQMQIIAALEKAVRLNPLNAEYHLRAGWQYTYLWKKPDYKRRWLPAADISMERAAYFAGESRPHLHVELGNYWVMRSKSMDPADAGWEPAWIKACWHYKKAQQIEKGRSRKEMVNRIKNYIRNYYPDEYFVGQALISNS